MSLHSTLTGQTENEKAEWYDLIGQFRNKAQEFVTAYNDLLARANDISKYPALQREYRNLVSNGQTIRKRISAVTTTIDKVTQWFDSTFGGLDDNSQSLGAIWIPVAVVVASVTAISKWVLDYVTFTNKLEEVKRLEAGGLTPQAAANTVAKLDPQGGLANIFQSITPVIVLGALIIFSRIKK